MASCLFISTCGLALGLVNSIPYQEDGTYRLALQEYVLIVGGIPCTRLNTRAGGDDRSFEYSNSILVPLFCLTKTECFLSYERYNKVLRALPKLLFDAEDGVGGALLVSHGGLDRTSAILNAFRSVWPEIICIPDPVHLQRKIAEGKFAKQFTEGCSSKTRELIEADVLLLRKCPRSAVSQSVFRVKTRASGLQCGWVCPTDVACATHEAFSCRPCGGRHIRHAGRSPGTLMLSLSSKVSAQSVLKN